MSTIVTGVVIGLIGTANLVTGRMHPERINARLQRGMGWVGIASGAVLAIAGILSVIRPNP